MNHLKIRISLIILLLGLLVVSIFAQSEISITAKQNLALQSKPDYDSDVLGIFQRGQEAAAFGRDEAGAWLQINDGWIIAKNVDADSDIMALPVTTDAVTVKAAASRSLRSGPDDSFDATGNLPSGETMLALGRNGDGSWLQVSGGWIPADQVEISGGVMALPITFSSITIRANINVALHRGPSRDAEVLAILARGEEAVATSRNEAGTLVQTPQGWIFVNRGLALEGEIMELPLAPTVSVTAAQALTLHSRPSHDFDRLAVVKQGEQDIAFGRDETGIWLQLPGGWVSAERGLETRGDIMDLPITGQTGITITPILPGGSTIRSRPRPHSTSNRVIGRLRKGEEALAIGRNEKGNWLQIESGWVLANWVKADGNIMELPVTSGESSTQSIAKASPRDGVTITPILPGGSSIRSRPHSTSNRVVGHLRKGEEAVAIGRNEDGKWLQIESGWVLATWVKANGDIMDLPITGQAGIIITATHNVSVRTGSSALSDRVGSLGRGEEALAIGRSQGGYWLRIESGWVLASPVKAAGDIMDLPIVSEESSTQSIVKTSPRDGVTITSTAGSTIRSEPRFGRNVVGSLQRGEEAVAVGRTERGSWLQIESGWVSASFVKASGDIMDLPIVSEESSTQSAAKAASRDSVTAVTTTIGLSFVRSGPSVHSTVVRRLQRGEKIIAIGRDQRGDWLQIEDGWIYSGSVKADGSIMSLPITSGESSTQSIAKTSPRNGVTITAKYNIVPRSRPSLASDRIGSLRSGKETLAIGRSESGKWLQIESGWVLASYVKVDGDIMSLPVTSSTTVRTTTTSTGRATPTPSRSTSSTSAFSEQSIRSQVNRYTDDIRILKISQSGSATEIEYDLKPWPFVPNEQIAHEVLFKVICALRRGGQIPHKLEFTGQGHFKSDVGRKFKSPSVEIHISANNANRVICSGNTYSDINWRSLASRYKSHPIPSGARVDYG